MEIDPIDALADAVSDVGYWNWWDSALPDAFQVNFGGIQLWIPAIEEGEAPESHIAIRIMNPRSVAFLSSEDAPMPTDEWAQLMYEEELDPLFLDYEAFTFSDADLVEEILEDVAEINLVHGESPSADLFRGCPAGVAFWAGPCGFFACGDAIEIYSNHGEVQLADIPRMNEEWWGYWQGYWAAKETADPYPEDYACEVTVPADDDEEE